MMSATRSVEQLVYGRETSDGAGVKLTRVLGGNLHRRLDPFLMLDAFKNENPEDYIGGFPDHPHRGFETVTYMLAGRMRHHDSAGNSGLLEPGGAQWMTAASGLIHSELPEQENGLMEGFQLWLNLPAALKMSPPEYRDLPSAAIPEVTLPGVHVRVIAGAVLGTAGAVQRPVTTPEYWDVHLEAGASFSHDLPGELNALVYVYRGTARVGGVPGVDGVLGAEVPERHMGILRNDADAICIQAEVPTRLIVIAGRPLNEPIASYGPFVMNTPEQIQEAFADYQAGYFERVQVAKL